MNKFDESDRQVVRVALELPSGTNATGIWKHDYLISVHEARDLGLL